MKKLRISLPLLAAAATYGAAVRADEAPIGVFDSGLGGLTVLERLLDVDQVNNATGLYGPDGVPDLARESFVYLGDQANMPYGDYAAEGKSDYLRELILKDAKFLLSTNYYTRVEEQEPSGVKQRVKIIVIACNTATAWGLDDVRRYLASIGSDIKVVGVIEAGVRAALDQISATPDSPPFAIGVMATPGTIASGAYARTIRTELKVRGVTSNIPILNQGCAGLADAVEAGLPSADTIASSNLVALVTQHRASGSTVPIKAVILGCTHYPFVLGALNRTVAELRAQGAPLAADFRFVDPAFYTAAECHRLLRDAGRLSTAKKQASAMAFLSVANPNLPQECLTPDGQLTRKFKYGRTIGSDAVTTIPVPFTRERFGEATFANIRRLLPRTALLLERNGKQ
ncbi:MAG: aspartate/glutamate racemase family protein [Kiritimatiellae bacterium]|nr:aspartate/glutamate racemase family protein [Kiritimatiellia bacterium]